MPIWAFAIPSVVVVKLEYVQPSLGIAAPVIFTHAPLNLCHCIVQAAPPAVIPNEVAAA